MAATRTLLLSLLLSLLLLPGPPGRVRGQGSLGRDRRFSEFKRCADAECSMLMCRGEALGDFTGPDCRFVNLKKGDPVYIYYKLAGGSPELWAGTVGSTFGYFPKDLVRIDYEYTKEELQVPADETDFVCFNGERDEFDNYNVEDLLGFLELYDSATEDAAKAAEKEPPRAEQPPGGSAGGGPTAWPVHGAVEGGTQGPREQQPHAEPGTQAEVLSSEVTEEMLQESESNRTNTGPQAPGEQKMDTHQLLRKERTPLKTKFSSTVDAIVSDDETTGLVTSADDDLDSAGDREREGGGGDLDELPLLAFADAEELGPASEPRLQKSLAEVGPGSEEQGSAAAAPAPGTGTDHGDMLTDWGGTLFSIVTGGDGKMGMPDSEERKGGDNAGGPEGTRGRPPQAAEYFDSDNVDDFFVEVFKTTDDNDSGMDTELDSEENGRDVEDPEADRAPGESPPEATQHGGTGAHSSPLSRRPSSLPLAGEGKDTHRPALENTDSGLQEAAVHTAEDPLREGGPGARMAAGGSENSSVWKAAGRRATEETKGVQEQESSGAVPPGDEPHNTTGDHVQVPDLLPLPVQHRHGEHKEELGLETPDQPQFSPPEGGSSAGKPEEEVPALGEGLSQFHQRGAALGEPAAETESDLALHRAEQGAEEREPPDGTAAPGSPAEETEDEEEEQKEEEEEGELEDDEELPEELLEDENAVGAKRSQEIRTEIRDRRPLVMPGGSEEAHLGTIHPDPGAQENQQEPSVMLVIEKQNATEGREGAGPVRGLGSAVVGEEDEDPWAPESAPKGEEKAPSPRPGEALQKEDLVGVGPGGDSSGPLEKPVGEAGDMGSPGPASAEPGDDLSQQSPHAVLGEDGPIIRSFFKEQQALQRFLKYLDAHELEAMLQDMAAKLKVAQQESLPYNVGKVLDKAFRASEAQILSAAERMLDARMTGSRELGVKERSVLEEYAVLDDVQDLIYFVRYKHLAEEELALLTTAPTLDEGWRGPTQETQSPPGDPFLRENTADASVKLLEEPGPWGQQETGAAGASAETQRLNPEEDEAPGMIVTEGSGADPGGVESQREELAHTSPLESAVLMLHSFLPYLSKMYLGAASSDFLTLWRSKLWIRPVGRPLASSDVALLCNNSSLIDGHFIASLL